MGISNRGMAKWLEDFVQNINKGQNKSENHGQEKLAEINIDDLDKVVWNDETFYAMFDDKGATILNEFGNTVTTLQNAHTIQEVDQRLNSKQVVAEENEDPFEEELKKVSTYLNDDVTTDDVITNDSTENEVTADSLQQTTDNQQTNDEFAPTNADEFAPTTQPTPESSDTSTQIDDIENDINNTAKSLDVNERIASLEDMISQLSEQVQSLIQSQEYAHTDPGNVYDTGSEDLEMQHVQDAIEKGQELLDIEHSTDITTMDGRVSLKDKLHQLIDNIVNTDDVTDSDMDLVEIDPFEDSTEPIDQTSVEEPMVEETDVINPEISSEELSTEEPVVITVDDDSNKIPESSEDQTSEEPEIEQDKLVDEDKPDAATNYDELQENTPKMTTPQNGGPADSRHAKKQGDIVKLNSRDSKIFTKQICPHCGEQNLVKSKTASLMVGIYCKSCNTEYAVNTNTEEIYKKY